jgi:GT2 family glycosyltransferase
MKIAVLLTCFNRKAKTLSCLRSIALQQSPRATLQFVVVDDGSKDGTSQGVKQEFPDTTLIHGDGSLYWCGGMRTAWSHAAKDDPDYYFLVNDDTLLDDNALQTLLEMAGSPEARVIAVAAIRDPITGKRTYGGIRGSGNPVDITGELEACDTFNANAVLIPRAVFEQLGTFHKTYTHGMGDFDYGYQASKHGVQIFQSRRALGTCSQNGVAGSWRDRSLSRYRRLCMLQNPKGLPFREWVVFNRRNSGWKWPVRTISPYVRVLLGL